MSLGAPWVPAAAGECWYEECPVEMREEKWKKVEQPRRAAVRCLEPGDQTSGVSAIQWSRRRLLFVETEGDGDTSEGWFVEVRQGQKGEKSLRCSRQATKNQSPAVLRPISLETPLLLPSFPDQYSIVAQRTERRYSTELEALKTLSPPALRSSDLGSSRRGPAKISSLGLPLCSRVCFVRLPRAIMGLGMQRRASGDQFASDSLGASCGVLGVYVNLLDALLCRALGIGGKLVAPSLRVE